MILQLHEINPLSADKSTARIMYGNIAANVKIGYTFFKPVYVTNRTHEVDYNPPEDFIPPQIENSMLPGSGNLVQKETATFEGPEDGTAMPDLLGGAKGATIAVAGGPAGYTMFKTDGVIIGSRGAEQSTDDEKSMVRTSWTNRKMGPADGDQDWAGLLAGNTPMRCIPSGFPVPWNPTMNVNIGLFTGLIGMAPAIIKMTGEIMKQADEIKRLNNQS